MFRILQFDDFKIIKMYKIQFLIPENDNWEHSLQYIIEMEQASNCFRDNHVLLVWGFSVTLRPLISFMVLYFTVLGLFCKFLPN